MLASLSSVGAQAYTSPSGSRLNLGVYNPRTVDGSCGEETWPDTPPVGLAMVAKPFKWLWYIERHKS
jgi:hypothetical protein